MKKKTKIEKKILSIKCHINTVSLPKENKQNNPKIRGNKELKK